MSGGQTLGQRIARARQLLDEIHNIPVATVNADGSPHNSPVFMAFDDKLRGFWASDTGTQHSQNIARDGRVFLVVYDSREGHGGLYIEARAHALETEDEARHGYEQFRSLKEKVYGSSGGLELYIGAAPLRIYCAEPVKLWVNKSERNEQGVIIRDRRYEISIEQLLGQASN